MIQNEDLIAKISDLAAANDIEVMFEVSNDLIASVSYKDIRAFLHIIKEDHELRFANLIDIFAADFMDRLSRFEVVYNILSLKLNSRLIVKTYIQEQEHAKSVHDIFPGATWFEREAFDMYGIIFDYALDNRRILTDYGFEWFPLRKDFPLTGYQQVKYDEEKQAVVYEPVKLEQAYRDFDFTSPWFGPVYPKEDKQQ